MGLVLGELKEAGAGIEAVVLISSDAMPLASDMSVNMGEEEMSATAYYLMSSARRVAGELRKGYIHHLYLRAQGGDLVMARVNDDAFLACIVDGRAKMGNTLFEINRCAQKLDGII